MSAFLAYIIGSTQAEDYSDNEDVNNNDDDGERKLTH